MIEEQKIYTNGQNLDNEGIFTKSKDGNFSI